MITKEKYSRLRDYLTKGANLPPCDLEKMAEFEEKNGLVEVEGNVKFIKPLQS